jgi:hypothetical protein
MKHTVFALTAILAAGAAAQDAPSAAECVRKLGDEDFNVRDAAEKKLIQMGEAALPDLRKAAESPDVEVRERITRIIGEIERGLKVSQVYAPPAPITLSARAPLKEILSKIEGAPVDVSAIRDLLDSEVTVELKEAAPFELLDAVCRAHGSIAYRIDGGQIKFAREAFVDYPTVSVEAFRVKIGRIEKYSSDNFQKKEVAWAVTVWGEALPGCKTFGVPSVSLTEVVDEQGNKSKQTDRVFALGGENENNPQAQAVVRMGGLAWGAQAADPARKVFTFVSEREVAKLASVKGVASYFFRIDPRDVKFQNVAQRQEFETEDFKVVLDRGQRMGNVVIVGRGGRVKGSGEGEKLTLTIEPKRDTDKWLASVAGDLLEKDSVVAVDNEGQETKVEATYFGNQMGNVIMVNGQWQQQSLGTYTLDLGKLKVENVKEIRLKIPGVYRKDVPFEIKELKLP